MNFFASGHPLSGFSAKSIGLAEPSTPKSSSPVEA
jgi:hypothetical protein